MLDSVSSNEAVENVPDSVTGPQADPLGDGTVLLLGFGKLLLGAERLLRLYVRSSHGQLVPQCSNTFQPRGSKSRQHRRIVG
jgi:hypothetical protein